MFGRGIWKPDSIGFWKLETQKECAIEIGPRVYIIIKSGLCYLDACCRLCWWILPIWSPRIYFSAAWFGLMLVCYDGVQNNGLLP